MDKKILTLGMTILFMAGMMTASAIGPAAVTWVREGTYKSIPSSGDDTTEGGNITVLNIDTGANSSTERWAGYLGNISNTNMYIVLANSNADIFYEWSWNASNEAEVCAGLATSYNWGSIAAGAAADMDTAWSFPNSAEDRAVNTFTTTESITIAGNTIANAPSAATGPNVPGDTFETVLLTDSAGSTTDTDFLFCAEAQMTGGTGYDGSDVDYELMVPTTYGATETYYFYLELGDDQ